jgi:XcyI restriction endonuclease
LCSMEQARRPALAHHVHRTAPMGPRVLINGIWYKTLAAHSLRAELIFPVPILFESNPHLLGYYRLLYGFSQKAFYNAETGIGPFKGMETRGVIPSGCKKKLELLCKALIRCGVALLDGIGSTRISRELLDDLALLTVGPQLRGGANVKTGAAGIVKVFEAIHAIVKSATISFNETQITVKNAAGRTVYVEFAPDPDIVIREEMAPASFTEKIAIEVKAGKDVSNIHNRIGEAEKSHQKARGRGFVECWTVVNVDRLNMAMARQESPSTNRFYRLSAILSGTGTEYTDFRNRIISLTGIKF